MTEAESAVASVTLAGFVRVIGPPPAFVLPVFKVETGLAVQEIDDHDAIVGFQPADVGGLTVILPSNPIEKAVGAVCLVAYELSDGKILYGTPDELRAQLDDAIGNPALYDKKFTRWEIAEYCGREDILNEINNQIKREQIRSSSLDYFVGLDANSGGGTPISLFYSYSHKDEALRRKLEEFLAPLRHNGLINEWHDRNINAGEEWAKEIDQHLETADIILLLVSSAFMASRYCYSIEMKRALERHERGEAKVILVILRECHWKIAPFAKLQAVPENGKAVKSWSDQDKAFTNIAENVERVAILLRTQQAVGPVKVIRDLNLLRDLEFFRDVDAPWCPEMVMLPAGEFLMGSPKGEEGRRDNEGPQHRVTISRRFALGRYAVTFEEYDHFCAATQREKLMGEGWGRSRRPVINVSWRDAAAYCKWLSAATGQRYRLPSEAEWEYACRAGTTTPFSFGESISPVQVNYYFDPPFIHDNKLKLLSRGQTVPVGSLPANPWGLHEMHGNVSEWCADGERSYTADAVTDPVGPTKAGAYRVQRGGSWLDGAGHARSACRYAADPVDLYGRYYLGFRCARVQGS